MAVIKVATSFNIDVEFEIPEFYRRLLALLIDVFIEVLYFILANKIYIAIASNSDWTSDDTGHNLWAIGGLLMLPIALYHVVLEITMNGQSIGKKIMSIQVVSENGGRASIGQFLIRWLLRISDLWIIMILLLLALFPGQVRDVETFLVVLAALVFFVTDIVLVVSSRKAQRIGDILAHTILVRTNAKTSIEETVFQEVSDHYKPSFPEIMRLSDKDINAIKSILETSRKRGDFTMAAIAADKIKAHLKIESSMSPFDFLDILLKDYNYLSVK